MACTSQHLLDLDLAMLEAFPVAYNAIIPKCRGPKMAADKAVEVVLGTAGPGDAGDRGGSPGRVRRR